VVVEVVIGLDPIDRIESEQAIDHNICDRTDRIIGQFERFEQFEL
jgi:hypothetical protein